MKHTATFILLLFANGLGAQTTPYSGGNGSGAFANSSPSTVCPLYFGSIGSGSDLASAACTTTLPVALLSFTGEKQGVQNLLRWRVDDPATVGSFVLERSTDGTQYLKLAEFAGIGSPSYSYLDATPNAEKNFYRLLMTDIGGQRRYSQVLLLRDALSNIVKIFPNPASSSATVYVRADQAINATLNIHQADGKIVSKNIVRLALGANYISLDVQPLQNGTYFVTMEHTQSRIPIRIGPFVVVHEL